MAKTASLEAAADKTLAPKLKEPYGLVLRALAKEYSCAPFIIPERQAVQPADKAFEGGWPSAPAWAGRSSATFCRTRSLP